MVEGGAEDYVITLEQRLANVGVALGLTPSQMLEFTLEDLELYEEAITRKEYRIAQIMAEPLEAFLAMAIPHMKESNAEREKLAKGIQKTHKDMITKGLKRGRA